MHGMETWSWDAIEEAHGCPIGSLTRDYVLALVKARRLDMEDTGAVLKAVRWHQASQKPKVMTVVKPRPAQPQPRQGETRKERHEKRRGPQRKAFFSRVGLYEFRARLMASRFGMEVDLARRLVMSAPDSPLSDPLRRGQPPSGYELVEMVESIRVANGGELPFGPNWRKGLTPDEIATQKATGRGFGFWEFLYRQWVAGHPERRIKTKDGDALKSIYSRTIKSETELVDGIAASAGYSR